MTVRNPKGPPPYTRWKKGQTGNPGGRPKDPPEYNQMRNLTKKELVEIGNMVVKGEYAKIRQIAKNENASALHRMLASVVVRVTEDGDMKALDLLLNRLVGKVRDEILHQGELVTPPRIVITLPDNQRDKPNDDFGF